MQRYIEQALRRSASMSITIKLAGTAAKETIHSFDCKEEVCRTAGDQHAVVIAYLCMPKRPTCEHIAQCLDWELKLAVHASVLVCAC